MRILTEREIEMPVSWDVLEWRFEFLYQAGYPVSIAMSLAENRAVDIHHAAELLASGCTPDVAVRILS